MPEIADVVCDLVEGRQHVFCHLHSLFECVLVAHADALLGTAVGALGLAVGPAGAGMM